MLKNIGTFMESVKTHVCIGGTQVVEDQRKLSEGIHVVVGTPGRVFDMIQRRTLGKAFRLFFGIHFMFLMAG